MLFTALSSLRFSELIVVSLSWLDVLVGALGPGILVPLARNASLPKGVPADGAERPAALPAEAPLLPPSA
jgi:hypothetical protein